MPRKSNFRRNRKGGADPYEEGYNTPPRSPREADVPQAPLRRPVPQPPQQPVLERQFAQLGLNENDQFAPPNVQRRLAVEPNQQGQNMLGNVGDMLGNAAQNVGNMFAGLMGNQQNPNQQNPNQQGGKRRKSRKVNRKSKKVVRKSRKSKKVMRKSRKSRK